MLEPSPDDKGLSECGGGDNDGSNGGYGDGVIVLGSPGFDNDSNCPD